MIKADSANNSFQVWLSPEVEGKRIMKLNTKTLLVLLVCILLLASIVTVVLLQPLT